MSQKNYLNRQGFSTLHFRTPLLLGLWFGLLRANIRKDKSLLEVQVMTTFNPLKLVTIVLVIGLAAIPLYAQEQPGAQAGQSQSSAQSAQAQPQTFSGKIVKSKGGLALKDEASNTTYKLDNENQAKQFTGKNVKVTGTVDHATSAIHAPNIEMAACASI